MLQLRNKVQRRFLILADGAAIVGAFYAGYWMRGAFRQVYDIDLIPGIFLLKGLKPLESYRWLLLPILPLWVFWLNFFGLYKSTRIDTLYSTVWSLLKANFASSISLVFLLYLLRAAEMAPRSMILTLPVATSLVLTAERWIVHLWFTRAGIQKFNTANLVVVGTGAPAERLAVAFRNHPDWGYRVLGFLEFQETGAKRFADLPVMGTVANLPNLMHTMVIDHVVVSETQKNLEAVKELLMICEEEGVPGSVAADFFDLRIARAEMGEVDGIPLLSFATTPRNATALFVKRLMDIVLTALALLVLLPTVFLALAILIKLDSRGPILFAQIRSGLNGRAFRMYKFRSMVTNAEQLRDELEGRNEQDGPVFKIKEDPRITRVGRFIRKTSLDELPQLFNVLLGHMSIVGPRPPIPAEVGKYQRWQKRRLSMRPGLTCIWQVSGRNRVGFDEWMRMDLEYIDQWSLGLDIQLILKTFPVLLKVSGQ